MILDTSASSSPSERNNDKVADSYSNNNNDHHNGQRRYKILIVDDERDIGIIMQKALQLEGIYETDVYTNPKRALDNFKAAIYDLALIDFRMPDIDGMELYSQLKKIDDRLKVCYITAFDIDDDIIVKSKEKYPESRDACLILKPVSIDELISTIRRKLEDTK